MSLRKNTLAALGAALLALSAPAGASAATSTATANVNGGALSLTTTASPSFGLTLNGTDQTGTYALPTTVTDSRGNSQGWNLTIASSQFSTGGATPSTLPATASSITGVTNACVAGSTCTNPTNSVSYALAVPTGAQPAAKYFNAATSTGKGQFTNTPSVSVAVPANSDAGTYTSTLTVSAVSGP